MELSYRLLCHRNPNLLLRVHQAAAHIISYRFAHPRLTSRSPIPTYCPREPTTTSPLLARLQPLETLVSLRGPVKTCLNGFKDPRSLDYGMIEKAELYTDHNK
jgi:hypothetical protein